MKKTVQLFTLAMVGIFMTTIAAGQNAATPSAQPNDSKLAPVTESKKNEKPSKAVVSQPVAPPVDDLKPAPVLEAKTAVKPANPVPTGITNPPDTKTDPNYTVKQTEYKEPPAVKPVFPKPAPISSTNKKATTNQSLPKQVTTDN